MAVELIYSHDIRYEDLVIITGFPLTCDARSATTADVPDITGALFKQESLRSGHTGGDNMVNNDTVIIMVVRCGPTWPLTLSGGTSWYILPGLYLDSGSPSGIPSRFIFGFNDDQHPGLTQ